MPRFTESQTLESHNVGHFGYAAVPTDELEASQFTLATIVCDRSGSTAAFQGDMESALKSTIESLKGHADAEQIMVRVIAFSDTIEELHGFCPVTGIDESQYSDSLKPRGLTALFDSVISAAEATEDYSSKLAAKNFLNNGILIVITDGWNNAGRFRNPNDVSHVKEALSRAMKMEALESLMTILVAVNWNEARAELEAFHAEAGFTQQLIGVDVATPEAIARVGQFVATSISSTSMSLGSGGPSVPVAF